MEEVDKGCLMTRMGVSGRMFLLVPAQPGSTVQVVVVYQFNGPLRYGLHDKGPLNGCLCVWVACTEYTCFFRTKRYKLLKIAHSASINK